MRGEAVKLGHFRRCTCKTEKNATFPGVITRFILKSLAIEHRLVFRNLLHACFAEGRRRVPPVSSANEFLCLMLPSVTESSDFTMKKLTDRLKIQLS